MLHPQLAQHLKGFASADENDAPSQDSLVWEELSVPAICGGEAAVARVEQQTKEAHSVLSVRQQQLLQGTNSNFVNNDDDDDQWNSGCDRRWSPLSSIACLAAWPRMISLPVIKVYFVGVVSGMMILALAAVATRFTRLSELMATIVLAQAEDLDAAFRSFIFFALGVATTFAVPNLIIPHCLGKVIAIQAGSTDGDLSVFAKQQQVCRERVSALLGSVGAPPLIREQSSSSSSTTVGCVMSSTEVCHWLDFAVTFAQTHVDFVRCLHDALDVLQRGTSLQCLGVAPCRHNRAAGSAERLEKAALARWFRHCREQQQQQQQQCHTNNPQSVVGGLTAHPYGTPRSARFDRMPVAMPLLRRRLYRILKQQLHRMEQFATITVDDVDTIDPIWSRGNMDDCGDDEPAVVTLSMLRSMKGDALDVLSCILNDLLDPADITSKRINQRQLQICIDEAKCSMEYLKSAVSCCSAGAESTSGADANANVQHTLQLEPIFQCLQDQAETFRVALMAQQEELSSIEIRLLTDPNGSTNDGLAWWESIRKLSSDMHIAVEELNSRLRIGEDGDESGENGGEIDRQSSRTDDDDDHNEEYAALVDVHDLCVGPVLERKVEEHLTLVFSGVAAQQKRNRRQRLMPSFDLNGVSTNPQQHLFAELRERLQSMPPVNEFDVNQSDVTVPSMKDDAINLLASQSTVRHREVLPVGHCMVNELFLGELKKSIIALPTAVDGDCFE